MHKVWFRFLIILYVCAVVFFAWLVWYKVSNFLWGQCYGDLYLFVENNETFQQMFRQCGIDRAAGLKPAIFGTLITLLVTHYVIQFIFFKIVVDFITLGHTSKD